MHQSSFLFV